MDHKNKICLHVGLNDGDNLPDYILTDKDINVYDEGDSWEDWGTARVGAYANHARHVNIEYDKSVVSPTLLFVDIGYIIEECSPVSMQFENQRDVIFAVTESEDWSHSYYVVKRTNN